ncbi:MAG TPA: hypothetical protein EYN06_04660 [Myxococcales bacterium]|nr:hypothetical protein [Myxococcales bacterium]HIN85753.1 hypothetical protein [Myxococcales bacterium]
MGRMERLKRQLLVTFVLMSCVSNIAMAQGSCEDIVEVDRFRHLRQLSLDFFERVPTVDELNQLHSRSSVSDEQISTMVNSEEFSHFIRRYHKELLWPQVNIEDFVGPGISLLLPASFFTGVANEERLFIVFVGIYERGGIVPCLNEPAEFDQDGQPILKLQPDGTLREGYVMVKPYWAPGTEIKVCALEARLKAVANNGESCDSAGGMTTGTCGCGIGLRHCMGIVAAQTVQYSLQEQLLRMVEGPIAEGRSYFDILTEAVEQLNGPLVHFYRFQVQMAVDPIIQFPPVPVYKLPTDISYTDQSWKAYPRSKEHSGVLTSLSYLLRFQTPRARANRFYDAFFCSPFQAPDVALPSPSDACSQEPDLRLRCGCSMCHAQLEPAAAYWARFSDAGSMYLDPAYFPVFSQKCADCANNPMVPCDFICDRFYLTQIGHPDEASWIGTLRSFEFRDENEIAKATGGPALLVEESIQDGRLPKCTVNKLFERLIRRPMKPDELKNLRPQLIAQFEESGFDFRALVRAIVMTEAYRRLVR